MKRTSCGRSHTPPHTLGLTHTHTHTLMLTSLSLSRSQSTELGCDVHQRAACSLPPGHSNRLLKSDDGSLQPVLGQMFLPKTVYNWHNITFHLFCKQGEEPAVSHLLARLESRFAELLVIVPVFGIPRIEETGKSVRALGDTQLREEKHLLNKNARQSCIIRRAAKVVSRC